VKTFLLPSSSELCLAVTPGMICINSLRKPSSCKYILSRILALNSCQALWPLDHQLSRHKRRGVELFFSDLAFIFCAKSLSTPSIDAMMAYNSLNAP
jgi:hypothetical protein